MSSETVTTETAADHERQEAAQEALHGPTGDAPEAKAFDKAASGTVGLTPADIREQLKALAAGTEPDIDLDADDSGRPAKATATTTTAESPTSWLPEALQPKLDAESEAKAADEAKPKSGEKPAGWDKDRQAKDQEIANLRKGMEELKATVETLKTGKPDTGVEPEDEPEIDGGEAKEDLKDLSNGDLLKKLTLLDEFATEEDTRNRLNDIVTVLKARETERLERSEVRNAERRDTRALNKVLDEACEVAGGAQHRADIMTQAQTTMEARGYTADKLPTTEQFADLVQSIAWRIKATAAPGKQTAKSKLTTDTGRGGRSARLGITGMPKTLDESVDQMIAEGHPALTRLMGR